MLDGDLINKLIVEYNNVQILLERLIHFIESDKYNELDGEDKTLLNEQKMIMFKYSEILIRRIQKKVR